MERDDLAAMFARVTRRLVDAELPVLRAHGVSMWGYAVLSRLAQHPTPTQMALAEAIGYDKTRLIALLDDLERDGLIVRQPDPSDRRAHTVSLTQTGRARHAAAQADIRAMETEILAALSATEQHTLLTALPRLATDHDGKTPRTR